MESKYKHIVDVDRPGVFIYSYTDKLNSYFFLQGDDRTLLQYITNKSLEIVDVKEIVIPDLFHTMVDTKFFKPYDLNGEYVFMGISFFKEREIKFAIQNGNFSYKEECSHIPFYIDGLIDYDLVSYITKRNHIYFVGKDHSPEQNAHDYVYGVFDTDKNILSQMQYFYSDKGKVLLKSLSIDLQNKSIYIVGGVAKSNGQNRPFVEQAFLRPGFRTRRPGNEVTCTIA